MVLGDGKVGILPETHREQLSSKSNQNVSEKVNFTTTEKQRTPSKLLDGGAETENKGTTGEEPGTAL